MRFPPKSIRGKLIFYGALNVLVGTALVFYLNFKVTEQETRSILQRHMSENAALITGIIETAEDVAARQVTLEGFHLAEEEGHEVLLVDREQMVIASSRRESVGQPVGEGTAHAEMSLRGILVGELPFATEDMVHRGVRVIAFTLPVHGDPLDRTAITGALHYMEPYAEYTALLERVLAGYLLFTLLLLSFLLVPVYVFLSRTIFAPVRQLVASNRAVAEGNREAMFIPEGVIPDDEIGQAMRTRNRMLTYLETHARKLAESDRALESMLDVLIVANPDGTIRTVNRAALELLSYAEEEIIGKSVDTIFEQEAPFRGTGLVQLVRDRAARDMELTLLVKSGERIPVVFNGSVIRDDAGRLMGMVGVARDITERKRAEEALRKAHDELERRVEERTAELVTVNEQLKREIEERKRAEKELQRNYQIQTVLNALLHISLIDISLEEQLQLILEHIISIPWLALERKGGIFLVEDEPEVLVMKVQHGLATPLLDMCRRVPFGRCLCGRAALSGKVEFADRVDDRHDNRYEGISPHGHYCVPVLSAGKVMGVISLYLREGHRRDEREEGFLRAVADVLAGIIERRLSEEELRHTLEKLRKALDATIQAIALTVEARDSYTAGHQRRVANLARAIATEMGLSKEQIDGIRMAGIIHDIGKISIPAEILSKPGRLDDLQYGLIQAHSQIGYDILKTVDFPWPVAQMVLQHHERIDGSGYPQGLSGEDIMLEARILVVADVVEAMASFRPYRPALGIDKALAEISQNRGILYDPEAVDACLKLFTEKRFKLE